jgi:hypothetical protein
MKKKGKNGIGLFLAAMAVIGISCNDNDNITVTNPTADFDAVLSVNEGAAANPNVDVAVDANSSSSIEAKVSFTSTSKDMARLYITQNIKGAGETQYKPSESIDKKADGSIDLSNKNSKSFDFQFALPVPAGIGTGTVVYKFWTTTGNGDFRDPSQRLAVGPGTITLKYGAATNPDANSAKVKSYPDVKLFAPTADGSSKTFVSMADGVTYNVSSGIEYVSLWDVGYLYSTATTDAATLRAPYNYPSIAIDIPVKAGTTNDELNKTYFKRSTVSTAEFDEVNTAGDLNFSTIEKVDANLVVTQLAVNDVVEFIDQYGKKGLIKVLQVNGTNGSDGFIRIAIKVQP